MKDLIIVTGIVAFFLASSVYSSEMSIPQKNISVTESFDEFKGTFDTLPAGFAVSKNGSSIMESDDDDFRGVKANSTTTGGCYAWSISDGDLALGCQPIEADFTPGWFTLTARNDSISIIKEISITYDVICRNNAGRSSSIHLMISEDNQTYKLLPEFSFTSQESSSDTSLWETNRVSSKIITDQPLKVSGVFYLRWQIDDAGGSGSRDELGINNLSITLLKPAPTSITLQ